MFWWYWITKGKELWTVRFVSALKIPSLLCLGTVEKKILGWNSLVTEMWTWYVPNSGHKRYASAILQGTDLRSYSSTRYTPALCGIGLIEIRILLFPTSGCFRSNLIRKALRLFPVQTPLNASWRGLHKDTSLSQNVRSGIQSIWNVNALCAPLPRQLLWHVRHAGSLHM